MAFDDWTIHYLDNGERVVEVNSINTEILNTGGNIRYVFQVPSSEPRDDGKCNIFIYKNELYLEWVLDNTKKIVKSISIPGKPKMSCYNGELTFWIMEE